MTNEEAVELIEEIHDIDLLNVDSCVITPLVLSSIGWRINNMNDILEQLAERKENTNKLMQLVSALITKTAQLQVKIKSLERYIDEDRDIS